LVVNYIPLVASISLWAYYLSNKEGFITALLVSIYSILLYLALESKKTSTIDGIIEFTEDASGGKTFQLIVNKDPETFKDLDEVIFLFKDVS